MTVFDKSFIHGITTEEAAVFDVHFMSNLTPLFFVEVLADLAFEVVPAPARPHLRGRPDGNERGDIGDGRGAEPHPLASDLGHPPSVAP